MFYILTVIFRVTVIFVTILWKNLTFADEKAFCRQAAIVELRMQNVRI